MKQFAPNAIERLDLFANILYKWNSKFNLTSYSKEEFLTVGVADCLVMARLLQTLKINEIVDIGTGYGMPGLVLKFLMPELSVCLVDASEKKIAFLEYISKIMDVRVDVQLKRLPDINWDRTFQCVVSKASMKEKQLLNISKNLLIGGGYLVYFVGIKAEIEASKLHLCGRVCYKRPNKSLSSILIRKKNDDSNHC